ncbi:MAG: S-layer homology domain-containing protein [Clostridia bacterium]|nr:S-layer homology domain-containing protein [Clostridia bacterium]
MKMKLTALILILVLLCPAFSAMADFSDIAGLDCEQDVRFLETLGIVEGYSANEYAPDELLSRAEMVTIALRTMDMYAPDYTGDDIFSDVDGDYWAYYEISAAYEMGLVNGVGDGRFAPEQPVSFNQAVKMLVNVLGYGYIAEI